MEREEEERIVGDSRKQVELSNLEKSSILREYMDDTSNKDQSFSTET